MNKNQGFTLLELMVTVAIVAILASIAIPSYKNYVIKSHVRSATSDLVSLSLVLENLYQRNLQYPASSYPTGYIDPTGASGYLASNNGIAWKPAESDNFDYTINIISNSSYVLKAVGKSTAQNANCTITLDNTNKRTISTDVGCGGITSW